MIRNSWYMAGPARSFKFALQKKVITGLPLVMWRGIDGKVVAFDGRCPHKGFPLWDSNLLKNGTLQCGYHGMCFDDAGKCVDIPTQRDIPIASAIRLRGYEIVEQDGLVWIWPGDAIKSKGILPPRIPELLDPAYEAVIADPPVRIRANYRLLIENILDITHFYPLHDGNIGDLSNSFIVPKLEQFEVTGNPVIKMSREATDYQLPPFFQRWFDLDVVDRVHTHTMTGPGLIRVDLRVAPKGKLGTTEQRGYIVCNTNTPLDENNLEWHWIMIAQAGQRYKPDPSMTLVQGIVSEFPAVVREDEWALAKQHEALEFTSEFADGTSFREINLRADTGVAAARKILGKMEQEEGGHLFGLPKSSAQEAGLAAEPARATTV
jgi:nitrite reductase/ring-hydroxylating ferredoxin subunit